jgi:hypothetical protein
MTKPARKKKQPTYGNPGKFYTNGLCTIFYLHNSSLQYFTVMSNNQVTHSLKEEPEGYA